MEQVVKSYFLEDAEESVFPMLSVLFDSRIPGESREDILFDERMMPSLLLLLRDIQREIRHSM